MYMKKILSLALIVSLTATMIITQTGCEKKVDPVTKTSYYFDTVCQITIYDMDGMQTDARADVFSFGVLLRWLVTGSDRKNDNIRLYGPVQKIIGKCTAFSPEARYQNVAEVKKALVMANPRAQRMRVAKIVSCILVVSILPASSFSVSAPCSISVSPPSLISISP